MISIGPIKWRSAVDLAGELGLHRNQIQSLVEQFGKEGMLMLARNNIMYISPRDEMLVRKHYEQLERVAQLPMLAQVAQDLGFITWIKRDRNTIAFKVIFPHADQERTFEIDL